MQDNLCTAIFNVLADAVEPLETKEIGERLKEQKIKESITRTRVFYRLNILRGEGKIKGKFAGPGKGVWIWWNVNAFQKEVKDGKKK